jgi:Spy/CpxP family protein refolding chaperone
VTTKAADTTADATAKTADMTATTAAGAETSDVAAANATPAKTTDVTAAKAPAASSATTAATTTAAGIGSDGDEGHHEEQHRGNADAGLQHRLRITDIDQIRYYGRPLSRERMDAQGRTESS